MRRIILPLLALLLTSASSPPSTPLCRVEAHVSSAIVGRTLTVFLKPGCPANGVAHLKLTSKLGGSQPDFPPGVYTLRPHQTLRKVALEWWSLVWIDRIGREWRVPELP
jgi:hypothetical protein